MKIIVLSFLAFCSLQLIGISYSLPDTSAYMMTEQEIHFSSERVASQLVINESEKPIKAVENSKVSISAVPDKNEMEKVVITGRRGRLYDTGIGYSRSKSVN